MTALLAAVLIGFVVSLAIAGIGLLLMILF